MQSKWQTNTPDGHSLVLELAPLPSPCSPTVLRPPPQHHSWQMTFFPLKSYGVFQMHLFYSRIRTIEVQSSLHDRGLLNATNPSTEISLWAWERIVSAIKPRKIHCVSSLLILEINIWIAIWYISFWKYYLANVWSDTSLLLKFESNTLIGSVGISHEYHPCLMYGRCELSPL